MTATVLRADALRLPLADETVDLICTSPPYFGLRSYTDGGEHYAGQLGSEATPAEFIDALLAATREMMRVLKPSGSIWVNLGDKYSGAQQQSHGQQSVEASSSYWQRTDPKRTGIPNKSLMGIPWRYAIACIDRLGLILRAEVIWSKPNGLPESVTDRVRRSHEQWFHFVRQPRYYSAVDEIREPQQHTLARTGIHREGKWALSDGNGDSRFRVTDRTLHPLGKLPGSVWTIPTEPLTVPAEIGVDHFAAFPTEWPRRIIAGWSPQGICTACGEGRRPVAHKTSAIAANGVTCLRCNKDHGRTRSDSEYMAAAVADQFVCSETSIIGYTCACADTSMPRVNATWVTVPDGQVFYGTPPPTRPAVVLDPFAGTGTVPLVADILGRTGIGVDLSADYCRLAQWRTRDPGQRARAARVDKPPPVIDGQLTLEVGMESTAQSRPAGGLAYAALKGRDCSSCGYRTQYAKGVCNRCGTPLKVGP